MAKKGFSEAKIYKKPYFLRWKIGFFAMSRVRKNDFSYVQK